MIDSKRFIHLLNFKKSVDKLPVEELKVANCPVCNRLVSHVYFMQDATTKAKSKWFSCSCGIIFNSVKPSKVYDKGFTLKQKISQRDKDIYEYPVKIYAPIIDDITYGRRVLIVGQNNGYQENALKERGWVPTVIDKNMTNPPRENLISADFESYEFTEEQKYNMIWFYHSFECLSNPIGSLEACSKLLAEDGIIFIASPDTDFINTRSSSFFIHWKHDENYIMWNRSSITKHLEKLGFNVILKRQNHEPRFPIWDDFHVIAQKNFF